MNRLASKQKPETRPEQPERVLAEVQRAFVLQRKLPKRRSICSRAVCGGHRAAGALPYTASFPQTPAVVTPLRFTSMSRTQTLR